MMVSTASCSWDLLLIWIAGLPRSAHSNNLCSLLGINDLLQLVPACLELHLSLQHVVMCPGCFERPRQFALPCGHRMCGCTAPICPRCGNDFSQREREVESL